MPIHPTCVHGAEMRVAETRAVNRALRKAYGIGICSVEEIGSLSETSSPSRESKKLPPQPVNGNNGNYGGPKVRDRLCQLIRQHQLDANLVKSYAVDFCGTKSLREASRVQVENFVTHLADWAEKDRNALLCQLNSYPTQSLPAEKGLYCPLDYYLDPPIPPIARSRCYHHRCEETICWFSKTQAVSGGEESDHLVLHGSRADGDREGSKAAEDQHEQFRGVRRPKRSSPENPLIPLQL